jgi:hypothetical protein
MRIPIILCATVLVALIALTAAKLAVGREEAISKPTLFPSLIPTLAAVPSESVGGTATAVGASVPDATDAACCVPTAMVMATTTTTTGMAMDAADEPLLARSYRPQNGDRLTILEPGVLHLRRVTADPLRINVLIFDLAAPEFSLGVGLHEGWLGGRVRTSTLANDYAAFAAVNGDLFAENGLPQGLTMINGRTAIAPKRRATFAMSHTGEPFIGYFTDEWTWQAEVRSPGGSRFPITLLNQPCVQGQICVYNDFARTVAARKGAVVVRLDPAGVVSEVVEAEGMRLRTREQALLGTGAAARWLAANANVGTRLQISIGTQPPLSQYEHAISGGPIILREGAFVQDCMCALGDCSLTARPKAKLRCEDFSTDWKEKHYHSVRMPRTGIGFDAERRRLVVAVVDGYQRGYSRGITQREFADLLREFGASEAMELDGGGSSTMVLGGEVINRPPDQSGERYVANALLFFWNEEAEVLPSRRQ